MTHPRSVTFHNLFFLSFWHHKEQLWSKLFFPLEKVKYLEYFLKIGPQKGAEPPPPPTPPHKGEKFFFAFLDELGHSKHKIKSVTFTSNPAPPAPPKKV